MSYSQARIVFASAAVLLSAVGVCASMLITFEDLTAGTTLSNQYAAQGVTFSPNAFSGAGGPNGAWGTNTDMTVVSSTGSDVGGLGTPALVSGNLLRSFNGWLAENGDPSFLATFSSPISSFSANFAGISVAANTKIIAYNGATVVGNATAPTAGQVLLSVAAPSITSVAILPGDFNDWVGVDNISFAIVPEPATLSTLGLAGVALLRRSRKA